MNKINPVCRKIDDSYVVWFPNGNQYLRFEEPAFFVFQEYENGTERNLIIDRCTKRYRTGKKESRQFVAEILSRIDTITQTPVKNGRNDSDFPELQTKLFTPFSVHNYCIGNKILQFRFEIPLFEHFQHPLIQHLETTEHRDGSTLFELFAHAGEVVLRVDRQVKGMWTHDETHLLNGMTSLQMLNTIYDKQDNDWMAVIHASAVTNGTKTIVFTASPGSGKSTIAALLQKSGFTLVSDDFVPVERISRHVFSFPAAISVKEGATALLSTLYPSLLTKEKAQPNRTNKLVRYLPVDGNAEPAPVKEIIFIKYDPGTDFETVKLSRTEALPMLLDETWTEPSAGNAAQFLDWYCGIACYRLSYSNTRKAIQFITELFEQ